MSQEEIARILEALAGINGRVDILEEQTMDNGKILAAVVARLDSLSEQVNRSNPVWTFIFRAMEGYGNLISTNNLFKGFAFIFWSLIMGVIILAGASKIGLDVDDAMGTVERAAERSRALVGPAVPGSSSPVTTTTGVLP